MTSGRLEGIFIAAEHRAPTQSRAEISALAERGLEGDRHCKVRSERALRREVTLVSQHALETLENMGIHLEPRQTRRNLLTSGVDLNSLVDRTFAVGEIMLRGVKLCQPCSHLERMTGLELLGPMHDLGGLCAAILSDGVLRVGDPITVPDPTPELTIS